MLIIWCLTYLARAGLSPAGIIDLAQPHTPVIWFQSLANNLLPDNDAAFKIK